MTQALTRPSTDRCRSRSLLSTVKHALYGLLMFTVGPGEYYHHGSVHPDRGASPRLVCSRCYSAAEVGSSLRSATERGSANPRDR